MGEESATLVKYTGTDAKVTIPKTVKKLPVTKIGKKAFSGNTTIKSVMINQTITEIGEEAFSNCPNLNNIYIKGQIDKIKIKKKCIS